MFYYKIEKGVVAGKYTTEPRFDCVTSAEDVALGASYAEDAKTGVGVFSESPSSRGRVSLLREAAYAHPHTGTLKHFQEAAVKRAMNDEEGALAAEADGLNRRAEIQAEYPFDE